MKRSRAGFSRRALLCSLAAAALPASARTQGELDAVLPGARLHGRGEMSFLGQTIYEARLWVTDGFSPGAYARLPLALELTYAMALSGSRLASRSLQEMQRQRALTASQRSRWLAAMEQAFPDVAKGDRLLGVLVPGSGARFFHNGEPRGEVADPEFATLFFGVWLSPRTSEPALRAMLLGVPE